jgi:hypothetical protein
VKTSEVTSNLHLVDKVGKENLKCDIRGEEKTKQTKQICYDSYK